jgi:hypothetical protein
MSHGKGFNVCEEGHTINMLGAVDVGGVAKVCRYVNTKLYAKLNIIVTMGVVTNTTTMTCYESEDGGGTGEDAIGTVYYYAETTAAGDTMAARTSGATVVTGTNDNTTFVIDIDASSLAAGHEWVTLKTDAAAAAMISVVGVLSGARHQSGITPTVQT